MLFISVLFCYRVSVHCTWKVLRRYVGRLSDSSRFHFWLVLVLTPTIVASETAGLAISRPFLWDQSTHPLAAHVGMAQNGVQ